MRYFFVAGEASGDVHAAGVIRHLRELDPEAEFQFLGGDEMAAAAGKEPLIHYNRMAYMGFVAVALHLREVLGNLKKAKQAIADFKPDALVLIDYPGFNLKLATYAKGLGIPVHYYIAPKLWAWKEYRIKKMRTDVDHIYSILPFEEEWFGERDCHVDYVGNPSVEEVNRALQSQPSAEEFRRIHGLDSREILAIVPGSRRGEISQNLPVMAEVAKRHPEFQPVIAGAPSIPREFYEQFTEIKVIDAATLQLMAQAKGALVTSGTASLECALAGTPQVVCYRTMGKKIVHKVFERILKIPYVSLPNLIACPTDRGERDRVNREVDATGVRMGIVPEMLAHHCNPDEVDRQLTPLLSDTPERKAQLEGYERVRERLHTTDSAARSVAERIVRTK